MAEARLQHTDVTARTLLIARAEHVEQLCGPRLFRQRGISLTTGMKITPLAERDELLNIGAKLLRLGQSGHDLLMLDERDRHIGEHGLAMACGAIELATGFSVAHGPFSSLEAASSGRGVVYSNASVLVFVPLRQFFNILRRPVRDFHTQMKAHLREHFLDLVQRLAAEVRSAEHLALRLLNEVADINDIVVLEAVGGTD